MTNALPIPSPKRGIPEDAPGLVFFRTIQSSLEYLYDRWRDESEYEDFDQYREAAKTYCQADGITFVRMTKTPFQLTYKSDGYVYSAKVTSRNVSITRVTK